MSDQNTNENNQPNNQPSERSIEKGSIREGFNKGEKVSNIGGGKADSGDYGRGHNKPPRPKENEK